MPSNKLRTLLQTSTSSDESLIFKFYSTGSLSACYADAEPTKSGADRTFVKINNILKPESMALVPELCKLIEAAAHPVMNVSIEYHDHTHEVLLKEIVSNKTIEPRLLLAYLAAAVFDTRDFTLTDAIEAGKVNEGRFEKVLELNAYRYFFRPDLGYFTQNVRAKYVGLENLQARQQEIATMIKKPVYELAQARVDSGVFTANLVNLGTPTEDYRGYGVTTYGASMILTTEELHELNELLVKNSVDNFYVSEEASLLLGYVFLTQGKARAQELIEFYLIYLRPGNSQHSWRRHINLDALDHPQGEVTFDKLVEAVDSLVDDSSTPLGWIIDLTL